MIRQVLRWFFKIVLGLGAVVGAIVLVWWETTAGGSSANVVVATDIVVGTLPTPWRGLAQGGEALNTFLDNNVADVAFLKPRIIRIDHIYDMLAQVSKNSSGVSVNWDNLDKVVRQIQKTGATPFLSLSYMPPALASGDIVSPPSDWNDWANLVKMTVEHYSGTLGIPGMYYEVWNEPDLFGKWRAGGSPNYFELYRYAALGASRAKVDHNFLIGGPSTTAPYQSWAEGFLDFVKTNNLRLDFYSWHRYSTSLKQYEDDISSVDSWFDKHPEFSRVPKIISEFGISSDRNPINDSVVAAAHEVAVATNALTRVDFLTAFSVKDADDAGGATYWGDWGLLTGDKSGGIKKPRYHAISFLNRLGPDRLSLLGDGSWVRGIAAKKGNVIQTLLVNYDPSGRHTETVPVKFTGLEQGEYDVRLNYLSGEGKRESLTTINAEISQQVYLKPNAVVLIEISPK